VGLVVGGLARGSSSAGEIKRARRGPSFIGSANQVRRRLGAVAASPSRVAAVLGGSIRGPVGSPPPPTPSPQQCI
jgi:hypothetical protein